MEKLVDRFANWIFTSCALLILIFLIGYAIDNFRVVFNMILMLIIFIGSGCVVYESINYIYKKLKKQ